MDRNEQAAVALSCQLQLNHDKRPLTLFFPVKPVNSMGLGFFKEAIFSHFNHAGYRPPRKDLQVPRTGGPVFAVAGTRDVLSRDYSES